MVETGNDGRRPHAGGLKRQRDRDLDRMLDLLAPPVPSDTLRARLKRDFDATGAPSHAAVAPGRKWPGQRGRWGGVAVAASLVLAVALGIAAPPTSDTPVARGNATATVYGPAATDGSLSDAELLAASAPDSALYMVATYNAGMAAVSPGVPDSSSTYGGATGTVSDVSYAGALSLDTIEDGDVFSLMPLE